MSRLKVFSLAIFGLIIPLVLAYGISEELLLKLQVFSPQNAYVQWAAPEGRVGPDGTNWDTLYYLKVKDLGGSTLFTMPNLAMTDTEGKDLSTTTLSTVASGTYNVYIKGHQSLTRRLSNVALAGGTNRLNFTQTDNASTTLGAVRLLTGDISGSTSSPALMGDDVVNAVDLSILINSLDYDDASGRGIRANLNQDPVINSVDLSLLLKNLDQEGDI